MEKHFPVLPRGVEVTPIPNLLFTTLMPQIGDISELKTILHVFRLLHAKQAHLRYLSYTELVSDPILANDIKEENKSLSETLHHALHLSVQHDILVHLTLDKDGTPEDIYFINFEDDRKAIAKIRRGELALPDLSSDNEIVPEPASAPNIFTLYEQNIGMLTPIIAQELQEAEKLYPAHWIESAFREAVTLNKRNWKYIARILERWTTEGKDDGKSRRDFRKEDTPDKYTKGKYGHLVKR